MSYWRALKMLLTLRCGESARLMSDTSLRDLTPVEKWSVRLHQVGCGRCRQMAAQFRKLDQMARTRAADSQQLSDGSRQRIARALAESDPANER